MQKVMIIMINRSKENEGFPWHFVLDWNVYVHTGNVHLAGTDSNVYLALIDSDGQETVEYQLTHANFEPEPNTLPIRNLFEKGARERFTINTPNLGPIAKINVRIQNASTSLMISMDSCKRSFSMKIISPATLRRLDLIKTKFVRMD